MSTSCPARRCPGQRFVFLINIVVQNVYAIFLLIYYNIADFTKNVIVQLLLVVTRYSKCDSGTPVGNHTLNRGLCATAYQVGIVRKFDCMHT